MEIKVCLQNLGKYNEGSLVFEWLTLPATEEEIEAVKKNIGINEYYEEWMIADYEAPFKIDEYDNLDELNELAEELDDIDEEVFTYFKDQGYDSRVAIEKTKDGDYTMIHRSSNTFSDPNAALADCYIDQIYGSIEGLSRETLEQHFDYESFGKTLSYDYTETSEGNWICSH